MSRPDKKREWAWSDDPILLPLAYEEREWNAAYIALHLAEYCGSTLHTFHVRARAGGVAATSFVSRLKGLAAALKVRITPHEKVLDRAARRAEIAREIVRLASQVEAQAIVMAGHKESFFTELFGRVSDRVARTAPCRVVLVESVKPHRELPPRLSSILVPVIRRGLDPEPLIVAAALTSTSTVPGAEITVARFVALPPTTPLDALESQEVVRTLEREFSTEVGDAIIRLGRVFNPKIVPVREYASDIRTYVKENGVELMILGGVRRPGRLRALLRPEEMAIVRSSPCPVAVVFPPPAGRR